MLFFVPARCPGPRVSWGTEAYPALLGGLQQAWWVLSCTYVTNCVEDSKDKLHLCISVQSYIPPPP